MEQNQYKIVKELVDLIEKNESKIRQIESLLNSCGLGCTINGTPANTFTRTVDYVSYNKDFIKKLLEEDRANYQSNLDILRKQFEEL